MASSFAGRRRTWASKWYHRLPRLFAPRKENCQHACLGTRCGFLLGLAEGLRGTTHQLLRIRARSHFEIGSSVDLWRYGIWHRDRRQQRSRLLLRLQRALLYRLVSVVRNQNVEMWSKLAPQSGTRTLETNREPSLRHVSSFWGIRGGELEANRAMGTAAVRERG